MRYVTLVFAVFMLAITPAATAANRPHSTLDAIATQVAGKPVSTWCETSWADWQTMTAAGQVPFGSGGFTYFSRPVVHLSPDMCSTLHAALRNGAPSVGAYWLAGALLTLAHESVHQRGVTDEHQADCIALPLVGPLTTQHFGVPATVAEQRVQTFTRTVVRKVRGVKVRIRVREARQVTTQVPNPFLAQVVSWATSWQRAFGPAC